LLVNEDLAWVEAAEHPLTIRYNQQLQEKGIPEWRPEIESSSK